jgi:hypothetical protein
MCTTFSTTTDVSLNDQKNAVDEQINMAKEKLMSLSENVPPELMQSIMDELSVGRVPPVFHALMMGKPYAALFEVTNNKLPCVDKAEPGHDKGFTQDDFDNAKPYKLGSRAMFLDGSIKNDGVPQLLLKDVGDEYFQYDEHATNVVVHLVNEKAVMCGYGVESTSMIALLGIEVEKSGTKSWTLLTHPKTRGVAADCLNFRETSFIFGSPGIGKSWSLLYALQQSLLFDNATVLLYACKVGHVFLFRRSANKIYAWLSISTGDANSKIMNRHDCLVLYDPPEADKPGARFLEGARQLIVALSANKRHAISAALKQNCGGQRYLGPPSLDQLRVMTPLMHLNDSWETIVHRIADVGPIARYILSEEAFQHRRGQRTATIKHMANDIHYLFKFFSADEMKEKNDPHFPETVFLAAGAQRNVNSSVEDYEGQHIDYKIRTMEHVSSVAIDELMLGCRALVLSHLKSMETHEYLRHAALFQAVGLSDLRSSWPIVMKRTRLWYKDAEVITLTLAIADMSKVQLQDELKRRSESPDGVIKVLIDRLVRYCVGMLTKLAKLRT